MLSEGAAMFYITSYKLSHTVSRCPDPRLWENAYSRDLQNVVFSPGSYIIISDTDYLQTAQPAPPALSSPRAGDLFMKRTDACFIVADVRSNSFLGGIETFVIVSGCDGWECRRTETKMLNNSKTVRVDHRCQRGAGCVP